MFIVRSIIWFILHISFKDKIHPLMDGDVLVLTRTPGGVGAGVLNTPGYPIGAILMY